MKRRYIPQQGNAEQEILNNMIVGNIQLDPLDVLNLRRDWRKWKQNFAILASNLPDHRRLALFLTHLGPQGIAIANSLLPGLGGQPTDMDTGCPSFDEVFTAFDNYCTTSNSTPKRAAEIYKFHSMALESGQDLLSFHTKLINQAELCGFRCAECDCSYANRIVRDRLLVATATIHPECLDIKDDPQVEDIFTKHQQIAQRKLIWGHVIPYLSLRDLESLWQVNDTFAALIKDHLVPDKDLVINGESIREYPPELHSSVYEKYSKFTGSIVLCEVPESDIPSICALFKNLDSLTLRRVEIGVRNEADNYPFAFRKLNLIKSVIDNNFLDYWFNQLAPYLKEFHVECPTYSVYWPKFTILKFDKLESITVHVPEAIGGNWFLNLNVPSLKRAKFTGKTGTDIMLFCPGLEKLELKLSEYVRYVLCKRFQFYNCYDSLKSLTLPHWKYWEKSDNLRFLKQFHVLEHLKIIESVDPSCRSDFDEKNFPLLKTREIHFWPEPDQTNLILTLNDYCLLHVMEYLPIEDQLSLFETHHRFESVFKRLNLSGVKFEINSENCTLAKRHPDTRKYLYEYVTDLCIRDGSEKGMHMFLKYFKNLKKLKLRHVNMLDEKSVVGVPAIEELVVDDNLGSWNIHPHFFLSVAHSLHTLDLTSTSGNRSNWEMFLELKKVKKLLLPHGINWTDQLTQFLSQNSDHMEFIKIRLITGDQNPFWTCVRSMKRLKHLIIERIDSSFIWFLQGRHNFPDLESLKLSTTALDLTPTKFAPISRIFSKSHKLHTFELRGAWGGLGVHIKNNFKNLKDLNIFWTTSMTGKDVNAICSMKELKTLKIANQHHGRTYCVEVETYESGVMKLIENLPNLIVLTINRPICIDLVPEIRDILKKENRTLIMEVRSNEYQFGDGSITTTIKLP